MCYVLVESAYVGVGGVRGAEMVPLPDELFGGICKVGCEIRDEAGRDESFGGGV